MEKIVPAERELTKAQAARKELVDDRNRFLQDPAFRKARGSAKGLGIYEMRLNPRRCR